MCINAYNNTILRNSKDEIRETEHSNYNITSNTENNTHTAKPKLK